MFYGTMKYKDIEESPFVCDSYESLAKDWDKIVWAILRLPNGKIVDLKKENK